MEQQSQTSKVIRFKGLFDVTNMISTFGEVALVTKKIGTFINEAKNGWKNDLNNADQGAFFSDNVRKIDMVLAYEDSDEEESELELPSERGGTPTSATSSGRKSRMGSQERKMLEQKRRRARKTFEKNLQLAGLELEYEYRAAAFDKKTSFTKIHVPAETLKRNADILQLRPPVKEFLVTAYMSTNKAMESVNQLRSMVKSMFDCDTIPPEPNIFSPGFLPDRANKYVIKEHCGALNHNQRSLIVWAMLNRTRYEDKSPEKVGIQRLIAKNVYKSAYPLHDGDYDYHDSEENSIKMNERRLLYLEWASLKNFYKRQPLWLIKNYFGVKIGLYFAWLGFYTKMLVIPAIVGIVIFLLGAFTVFTPWNQTSAEICNDQNTSSIYMCPECDSYCGYSELLNSCYLSRITYLFDNDFTVVFSIFMTIWATTFLEMWKRRQAILRWEWDLSDNEDLEEIRAEFEANVRTRRVNPVTKVMEAYVSGKEKLLRISFTWSVVLFMLSIVFVAVFSIIVLRIVLIRVMHVTTNEALKSEFFAKYAKLIGVGLAASVNALVIEVMGYFFQITARKLTDVEHHRTQTDYENSYTFKMFLFQFMNYYLSLMYTAFFKGRFYTYPGDEKSRIGFFTRLHADQCDPSGCLTDLCLMMAIYMVFRQVASNFVEFFLPKLKNWWRFFIYKSHLDKNSPRSATFYVHSLKRWELDYQLEEIDRLHLFDEYIEMIIQYGFVTIFVAAFPLAPLLALINNVFEIRLDAYKYTTQMRRPIAQQVQDIGIWYSILEGMTYLAVVSNAFIIALTSDFIPRMVYKYVYSEDRSMKGFVNFTLAVFDTADYGDPQSKEYFGPNLNTTVNVDTCRYRGFRSDPGTEGQYTINETWIHIFTARLGFIVLFEHFVLVIKIILAYLIPDAPNNLRVQLQRERQTQREAQFRQDQKERRFSLNMNNEEDYAESLDENHYHRLGSCRSRLTNAVSPI